MANTQLYFCENNLLVKHYIYWNTVYTKYEVKHTNCHLSLLDTLWVKIKRIGLVSDLSRLFINMYDYIYSNSNAN